MERFFLLVLMASVGMVEVSFAYPLTPDPKMTSGALCTPKDPDFERYRYGQKIPYCGRNVSRHEKTDIYEAYSIPSKCRSRYTIDHFIPLSIGGNNARENLWPEHKKVKALRPNLELDVFYAVREGRMTQDEAIDLIREAKMNPLDDPTIQRRYSECDK